MTRASAPGRVNLIGEHTDYNGGFVLPTTMPQQTSVALTLRTDLVVRARSDQTSTEWLGYRLGHEAQRQDWLDYVQGVSWALREAGYALPVGFDVDIRSDVPLGAGLSSSAALEVALLRAMREAFALDLTDVNLALLGQQAENEFVGARCGIMDQMAVALADARSALFLDTRSLEFRRVPLPEAADLVVIHSGVSHAISGGDYNTRRAECEESARLLGVAQLRDVRRADLPRLEQLPEPLRRRARHVVTEDDRVLAAVAALESSDLPALGQLFNASHVSMRDDFEVSVPEVDLLVELAQSEPRVFGARMTGGGFGGSVVMLVQRGAGHALGDQIAREYARRSGRSPSLLVPSG